MAAKVCICGLGFYPPRTYPQQKTCSQSCGQKLRFKTAPSPNRKKGFTVSHGYIMQYVGKQEGYASHYRAQHRLVMEQILGRSLKPYENVHHKNGIKSDNRKENLELWVIHQPIGVRVEDIKHCPTCKCGRH